MHDMFTTERLVFWHFILEEHPPNIKYIKWPDKYAVNGLNRIMLVNYGVTEIDITR